MVCWIKGRTLVADGGCRAEATDSEIDPRLILKPSKADYLADLSGAAHMDNPKVVRDFLRSRAGHAFCDDCIKAHTSVDRSEVSTIARTLALFENEFVRQTGECSERCSLRRKEVTMAIPQLR
jgi:hypothetical protein